MKKIYWLGLLLVFFGCWGINLPLWGQSAPFILGNDFIIPSLFTGVEDNEKINNFFYNSARIADITKHNCSLNIMPDFFGYNFVSFSYLFPWREMTFGFGYQNLWASDISQTGLASDNRPEIINYLTNENRLIRGSLAFPLFQSWYFGINANDYLLTIGTETKELVYADLGLYQEINKMIYWGVFSQQLLRFPSLIKYSQRWDTAPGLNVEIHLRFWNNQVGYLGNFNTHRLSAEIVLLPQFSLGIQKLFDKKFESKYLNLSTKITLYNCFLEYGMTFFSYGYLEQIMHQVGIKMIL